MADDQESKAVPTSEYRWVHDKDGNEVLQQRWVGGPNLEEWRTAPADAPKPPKIFSVE